MPVFCDEEEKSFSWELLTHFKIFLYNDSYYFSTLDIPWCNGKEWAHYSKHFTQC